MVIRRANIRFSLNPDETVFGTCRTLRRLTVLVIPESGITVKSCTRISDIEVEHALPAYDAVVRVRFKRSTQRTIEEVIRIWTARSGCVVKADLSGRISISKPLVELPHRTSIQVTRKRSNRLCCLRLGVYRPCIRRPKHDKFVDQRCPGFTQTCSDEIA